MPVIGRGDGHRVHIFIFQQFSQVLVDLRLTAAQLFDHLRSAFRLCLVHVADGHHARIRQLAVIPEVIAPASAQPDYTDADSIVRRARAHGRQPGRA